MNDMIVLGASKGTITVGERCSIGENVQIIFSGEGELNIADYVTIGDNVKMVIEGGKVSIGDWTTLHSGTTVFCKAGVSIGAHCWFGQNCVVDGTGGLTIEHGVRVGMFSQIWTHVAAGEQIEGCTLIGETPTHIESDVWLVGTGTVGSGVRIGRRTIALPGSNVTKNSPANVVLAGAPARVKEGLSFYRDVTLNEKFELLKAWLAEAPFVASGDAVISEDEGKLSVSFGERGTVVFYKRAADFAEAPAGSDGGITPCCIENKQYVKTLSDAERTVLKYLSGNKARFYVD